MAGLYIHIPYCNQACNYCNFHFSTSKSSKSELLSSLLMEMRLRKDFLNGELLSSVYFGGGTPSVLTVGELNSIFEEITKNFKIKDDAEITLEANPEDLTAEYIGALRKLPVNRLSIGVQSFFDDELSWMNRSHNATQSRNAISAAQDLGFENITIDLIYGIPVSSTRKWEQNIDNALALNVNHISAYCLTVEEKTMLQYLIAKGKIQETDDEIALEQFYILMNKLNSAGYKQYEISNFARAEKYAVHNSAYWKQEPYMGIGPSAHSFNKVMRCWNVSNNAQYIKQIHQGLMAHETETLTIENRFNEFIMTGLRTMWGCDKQTLKNEFPEIFNKVEAHVRQLIKEEKISDTGTHYVLKRDWRFFADGIASSLFV